MGIFKEVFNSLKGGIGIYKKYYSDSKTCGEPALESGGETAPQENIIKREPLPELGLGIHGTSDTYMVYYSNGHVSHVSPSPPEATTIIEIS